MLRPGIIKYRYEPERAFVPISLLLDFSSAGLGSRGAESALGTKPSVDGSSVAFSARSGDLDASRIRLTPVFVSRSDSVAKPSTARLREFIPSLTSRLSPRSREGPG